MLSEFYKTVDKELAAILPRCSACGECCDFPSRGYVLYASEAEVQYIFDNCDVDNLIDTGNPCPFQKDARCMIHSHRPLGCRTYHHDKNASIRAQATYEMFLTALKNLASERDEEWIYAPFVDIARKLQNDKA